MHINIRAMLYITQQIIDYKMGLLTSSASKLAVNLSDLRENSGKDVIFCGEFITKRKIASLGGRKSAEEYYKFRITVLKFRRLLTEVPGCFFLI
jgi:hypothetical protein